MATLAPLTFYFDFVSPYAHIAWPQVQRIAQRCARRVEPIPVLFAAMLNAHGQLGPAEIPAKRTHVFKDAYRKAHRYGLPTLVPPPSHPFNPLLGLRVATVAAALTKGTHDEVVGKVAASIDEGVHHAIIDALYASAWTTGEGIENEETVARALARVEGLDVRALLAAAGHAEIKALLRRHTEEAIARGVFGVPTVYLDGEVFWGNDSIEFVEAFVRGEDPVPKDLSWADRPVSAVRSR